MPRASIVIRSLNEQKYLESLLRMIEEQEFRDYETILVDSGSTDATLDIASKYVDKIVSIEQRNFTFGYSLNVGGQNADGDYIVMVSAHAIPTGQRWLSTLIDPFEDSKVAMTYGRHIGAQGTKFSEGQDFARTFGDSRTKRSPLPYYANNANSAVRKSLWDEHPFDEYLTGLEDIAWARHFVDRGYRVEYAPEASVFHIHEENWAQIKNRYRREAIAARNIGLEAPPHSDSSIVALLSNIRGDIGSALPKLTPQALNSILRFRFEQWRGTREGWTSVVDLKRDEDFGHYNIEKNEGVVIAERGHAQWRSLPTPELRPGDVLIKVAYVGVCQTDLEVLSGELGYYKDGSAHYPIVPGHEFSGEVVRIGANCKSLRIGDRVVGECIIYCGQCEQCKCGEASACTDRRETGVVNQDGAYAKYVTLPAKHVHRLSSGISLHSAVLAEPLAVVQKGLRRVAHRLTGKPRECAVIGAGPIGNLCAQLLLAQGHSVTVFDKRPDRLEFISMGARKETSLAKLERFALVVEATGNVHALQHVLSESRTDATLLLLGFPYGSFFFNFEKLVAAEKYVVGSVGSTGEDFEAAIASLPTIDSYALTRTIVPLYQYQHAWDLHTSGKHLKVILQADTSAGDQNDPAIGSVP